MKIELSAEYEEATLGEPNGMVSLSINGSFLYSTHAVTLPDAGPGSRDEVVINTLTALLRKVFTNAEPSIFEEIRHG